MREVKIMGKNAYKQKEANFFQGKKPIHNPKNLKRVSGIGRDMALLRMGEWDRIGNRKIGEEADKVLGSPSSHM